MLLSEARTDLSIARKWCSKAPKEVSGVRELSWRGVIESKTRVFDQ
jgi:hypothetical protein